MSGVLRTQRKKIYQPSYYSCICYCQSQRPRCEGDSFQETTGNVEYVWEKDIVIVMEYLNAKISSNLRGKPAPSRHTPGCG